MTALSLDNVTKTFGSTIALDDFSIAIRAGEFVSLLGPSGCGKTTALRVVAGFEIPNSGSVLVGGTDVSNIPAHRRNMGMVFQSYSLFPNMNVAQNIEFGLRTRRLAPSERKKRVEEALELVQLEAQATRFAHQLSGGQQQRVALARALAIRPDVLLLDEPLSALDAKVRSTLRDEIRRIQRESGTTTVFVTHDQDEALSISDRVGVMSNGRLEQLAEPEVVYSAPANAFVARFVGTINEVDGVVSDESIHIGDYRLPAPASARGRTAVKVLIRPEHTRFTETGLPATVRQSLFMGSSKLVDVELEGRPQTLRVQLPGHETSPEPGSRVQVSFEESKILIDR
jgi:putative spermidine/putrescine transport system ATP-binding protein